MRKLAPMQALDQDLAGYYAAFWYLNQARHYTTSGAPCGLSLLEKRAYCDEYDIFDREERRRTIRFISALDTAYITHFIKKMNAKNA